MPVNRESLKDFTLKLLDHPNTLFSLREVAGSCEIHWKAEGTDASVIAAALSRIRAAEQIDDGAFREGVWPEILEVLFESEVYASLGDQEIQVTQGHAGTSPLGHISAVVCATETDEFAQLCAELDLPFTLPRSVLRAAAALHDVGKCMSSGLAATEVRALMQHAGHTKHSYPNHVQISQLVVQTLKKYPAVAELFTVAEWEYIELLIEYHHFFEKLQGDTASLQVHEFMQLVQADKSLFFAMLLILTRADVNSNPNYRQYAELNTRVFESIAQAWADQFPRRVVIFWNALCRLLLATEAESSLP